MNLYKEIYRVKYPILENWIFHSMEVAKNYAKGDVILVQDLEIGLIFNQVFYLVLIKYDADSQNKTAVSGEFCKHLKNVTEAIRSHF